MFKPLRNSNAEFAHVLIQSAPNSIMTGPKYRLKDVVISERRLLSSPSPPLLPFVFPFYVEGYKPMSFSANLDTTTAFNLRGLEGIRFGLKSSKSARAEKQRE
ncbi:hypothetical protein ElyMa_004654200 [Elysia marginata]|uniref:Uncharacterized protein n=1 Tax=Elysia marginata TaxID=1093978 RepID=A0AAV4I5L4_9GAST|nr:hypothetical protein ElyMa_004654200 [Elysia marginata]